MWTCQACRTRALRSSLVVCVGEEKNASLLAGGVRGSFSPSECVRELYLYMQYLSDWGRNGRFSDCTFVVCFIVERIDAHNHLVPFVVVVTATFVSTRNGGEGGLGRNLVQRKEKLH